MLLQLTLVRTVRVHAPVDHGDGRPAGTADGLREAAAGDAGAQGAEPPR